MTQNKRFTLAYEKGNWWAVRDYDITLWKEEVIHLLNALHEENQQLKAQLYTDDEGVCNICKHQYLVGDNNGYYIAKCKKGHEECSKENVKHCEDFEIVEIDIND